ncbi:P-II family nitrogen regulator|uniref:Nitrogen regulatory protein P-II family n=1 Tax=Dendrosporobacter quercicolus TaxID=146817 RepID=A0A1G9SJC8_9FIRM|nr:P-II family nitrogen regulator [Dendrosporobacter quercicolus]NSL48697.1 P-II family nitrogen regulator [Dendrosporobacter quercicolus DSM 1736]SDM35583.1 nitrogen regulatory protein P-II family [Dendrosporobacter quercicolus]
MKEIIAVVRMNKVSATKRALIQAGAAGFTATKVMGRGRLVEDKAVIAERRVTLLALSRKKDQDTEKLLTEFLDGTRLFPRRLFNILAHDQDVPGIVEAIIEANRTEYGVGDGKIFVLPVTDAVRVRTKETGDAAI